MASRASQAGRVGKKIQVKKNINIRVRGNHLEEMVVVISLSHFGKEGAPEDDN